MDRKGRRMSWYCEGAISCDECGYEEIVEAMELAYSAAGFELQLPHDWEDDGDITTCPKCISEDM